jgi:hypothetical protein
VCMCVILCLCCPVFRYKPCDGPTTRPRSPTDCVQIQRENEKPRTPSEHGIRGKDIKNQFSMRENCLCLSIEKETRIFIMMVYKLYNIDR